MQRACVGAVRGGLLAALLVGASVAHAQWTALRPLSTALPAMAYDPARVRYEPPHVTAWTRIELPAAATLDNGVRYRSVLQKVAVDCTARVWAVTRSEFYGTREPGGTALYTYDAPRAEWEFSAARPGSNADALIRALCATPKPW